MGVGYSRTANRIWGGVGVQISPKLMILDSRWTPLDFISR